MKMIKKILRGILIFTICFTTMSISYQSMPVYAADESDYEKLYDSNYQPYEKTDKYIWIQIHTYNQDKSVNVRRVALYMKRGDKIPVDKLNLPKESELVKPSDDSTFLGWYIRRIDKRFDYNHQFNQDNLAYSENIDLSTPNFYKPQLIDDREKEYKLNDFTLDYYMCRDLFYEGNGSYKEFIIFPKFSKIVYHPYLGAEVGPEEGVFVFTRRILLPDDKYKEQVNKANEEFFEKNGYQISDYFDSDSRLPGISEGEAYSDEELIASAKSLYDGKRGELTWHVYRYGLLYTYLYPTAENVKISYKYTYIDKNNEKQEIEKKVYVKASDYSADDFYKALEWKPDDASEYFTGFKSDVEYKYYGEDDELDEPDEKMSRYYTGVLVVSSVRAVSYNHKYWDYEIDFNGQYNKDYVDVEEVSPGFSDNIREYSDDGEHVGLFSDNRINHHYQFFDSDEQNGKQIIEYVKKMSRPSELIDGLKYTGHSDVFGSTIPFWEWKSGEYNWDKLIGKEAITDSSKVSSYCTTLVKFSNAYVCFIAESEEKYKGNGAWGYHPEYMTLIEQKAVEPGKTLDLPKNTTGYSDLKPCHMCVFSDGGLTDKDEAGLSGLSDITPEAGKAYYVWLKGTKKDDGVKEDKTTYSINYDLGGGKVSENPSTYTTDTDTFTLNNPTRDGYTFLGWTGSNGVTPQTSVSVTKGTTGNLSFTANWEANSSEVTTYTITYDLGGGVASGNPTSYTSGTATFTLNNPTRDGYTFTGWTGSNGTAPQTSVSVTKGTTGNLSYTANWQEVMPTYTITYELNGGTVSNNPTTYTAETDTFTLNAPTRAGYIFTGWTGSNGTTPQTSVSVTKGTTGNLTYTANWREAPTAYTITYNLDGGSASGNPTSYTAETETFTFNNPTRNGYTFTGWTGSNGTTPQTSVSVTKGTTGNLTYTANWQLNPGTYTITYNLNGGTVSGNPDIYTVDTNTFTMNAPTRSGYTFTGWTGSNGNVPQLSVSINRGTTGNLTYTANWQKEPVTYTITYNLNGGTLSDRNPSTYSSDTETFYLNNPYRQGYTFTGWTGSNGDVPSTMVSVAKGTSGNLTFVANWQYTSSNVIDDGDSGDENGDNVNDDQTDQQIESIQSKKSKVTKLTAGKNKITLKFKKVTIDGKKVSYQVAIKKAGAKKWKKSYVSGTKKTFKKLKSGTTYWISVRPYITIDGDRYFGKWAKTKVKKTK